MYLGLLNLTILLVFGFTGLRAAFNKPSGPNPDSPARTESFAAPANVIDDKVMLEVVRQRLNIAAGNSNSKRDASNNLLLTYYTTTGPWFCDGDREGEPAADCAAARNQWRLRRQSSRAGEPEPGRLARQDVELLQRVLGVVSQPDGAQRNLPVALLTAGIPWAQVSFALGSGLFLLLVFLSR